VCIKLCGNTFVLSRVYIVKLLNGHDYHGIVDEHRKIVVVYVELVLNIVCCSANINSDYIAHFLIISF